MQSLTLTLAGLTANDIPAEFVAALEATLLPEGALECLYAAEIVRAAWHIQTSRIQDGTEDSHHQTLWLRRDTAALRQLQTDRRLNEAHGLNLPPLVNVKDFLKWRKATEPQKLQSEPNKEKLAEMIQHLDTVIEGEFTNRTQSPPPKSQQIPRNARCPCKSGQKHKRCCGKGAPPVLNKAA